MTIRCKLSVTTIQHLEIYMRPALVIEYDSTYAQIISMRKPNGASASIANMCAHIWSGTLYKLVRFGCTEPSDADPTQ